MEESLNFRTAYQGLSIMTGKNAYGDYQTPLDFCYKVCFYLKNNRHIKPSAVVEPTCGIGRFIYSSLILDAEEYYGIEINPEYCEICRNAVPDNRVKVINADLFSFSSKSLVHDKSSILIIGNPPWVTNSALSSFDSANLPKKSNFRGLRGIDAITGESNFDICEYIILHLANEYRNTNTTISLLCKTSVARKVFMELKRTDVGFSFFDILKFDASKVFGVNADACLLLIQLSDNAVSPDVCNVYEFDNPERVKFQFGFSGGRFYSNLDRADESFDGHCCFEWRQGVKHDCSKVMELTLCNGFLQNGQKERVEIENNYVYPLVKSSMFKAPVIHNFNKFVIVTQRKAREETQHLAYDAPKTWKYLNRNVEYFNDRKSSIYHNAPPFSMFGVGAYSYTRYKVGISGFYKQPLFSVLYSDDSKPVMTDDTSYFICFESFNMAYSAMLLLNSEKVKKFLESIAFLDAKRPYTKKVLERINLQGAVEKVTVHDLKNVEQSLRLSAYISDSIYDDFRLLVKERQNCFVAR